jgi:hypothetical protein
MSFLEICAQYKKIRFHSKSYVWSAPNTKKMVPFKKILSQIMNGLHTNHFCSMGTIMKFVIYMEVLDADLERIYNRLAFSRGGTCYSPPRRIAPKPSVSDIARGVGMTPARWAGASACTGGWYGPKPLTTMVRPKLGPELQQMPQFGPGKYRRNLVHLYARQPKTKWALQDSA